MSAESTPPVRTSALARAGLIVWIAAGVVLLATAARNLAAGARPTPPPAPSAGVSTAAAALVPSQRHYAADYTLRRLRGSDEILAWVRAGVPI